MFYVDISRLNPKREGLLVHLLPSAVVFCALVVVTMFSWTASRAAVNQEHVQSLQRLNTDTAELIGQHFDAYEDILRGAAGLFNASQDVTRSEWATYLAAYNVAARYPGIQGVGFASVVLPADVAAHTAKMRADNLPAYALHPAGERQIYTSIDYIEPQSNTNLNAIGYDMYSEPVRRAAMDAARDTGQINTSAIVTLLQDVSRGSNEPGFLMYMPVYWGGRTPDTVEARRQNLRGFVYAPFRTQDVIGKTVQDDDSYFGFRMYAMNSQGHPMVYESKYHQLARQSNSAKESTAIITLGGAGWELRGVADNRIVNSTVRGRPIGIFWGGLAFSALIAGLLYIVLGNRARALAQREEQGIQRAKDELLALASHQLRTPATGVKQYIGLLKEGLAGDLSDVQKELVDKAYASNERQLVTINEMLFVARSDAGRWQTEKEQLDICEMARDIVDEQRDVIQTQRRQKLTVKIPTKPLYMLGDKRYMRMAIENLLSNASKYTKPGGHVGVEVKPTRVAVRLKISDSGVGVAPEHRKLLFQKFSRIPNELTNKVVGSGIGLYLAKRVIAAHRGSIEFASQVDVGSTVTVTLPRYRTPVNRKPANG